MITHTYWYAVMVSEEVTVTAPVAVPVIVVVVPSKVPVVPPEVGSGATFAPYKPTDRVPVRDDAVRPGFRDPWIGVTITCLITCGEPRFCPMPKVNALDAAAVPDAEVIGL